MSMSFCRDEKHWQIKRFYGGKSNPSKGSLIFSEKDLYMGTVQEENIWRWLCHEGMQTLKKLMIWTAEHNYISLTVSFVCVYSTHGKSSWKTIQNEYTSGGQCIQPTSIIYPLVLEDWTTDVVHNEPKASVFDDPGIRLNNQLLLSFSKVTYFICKM